MKRLLFILFLIPFLPSCKSKSEKTGIYLGGAIVAYQKGEFKKGVAMADSAIALSLDYPYNYQAYKIRGKCKLALLDTASACKDLEEASLFNEYASNGSEEQILLSKFCNN